MSETMYLAVELNDNDLPARVFGIFTTAAKAARVATHYTTEDRAAALRFPVDRVEDNPILISAWKAIAREAAGE